MASFRTGFKIFRDISLKQGLGRIRSFSEDRKTGRWLPEDQWAVREPGSTCPEPCDKPRKPPKPSKSWLSICKDPAADSHKEIDCDIRHNNCPPPPETKETPWYSLDKLIPKKKPQEISPPLSSCREEIRRRQLVEEEEVCENITDTNNSLTFNPEPSECIMPKKEPCPAPVVTLSSPLPKELDISLWCTRPSTDTSRIPIICENDRLPYEEFRPRKIYKRPPFSLPIRGDLGYKPIHCSTQCITFSEFKQVEVPKPLYTRYKSVELSNNNLLFCMRDVKCQDDDSVTCLPLKSPTPLPIPCRNEPPEESEDSAEDSKVLESTEKPLLEVASCRPVRIKRATKFEFRPKPTKLIEKRVYKRPCARHKTSDSHRPQKGKSDDDCHSTSRRESSKVITGTLTDEPQVLERSYDRVCSHPPKWMYQVCKPGSRKTPLVPCKEEYAKEPDWSSETDGLKFYDGEDGNICPKPKPDPWVALCKSKAEKKPPPGTGKAAEAEEPHTPQFRDRFVLMPEKYKIKQKRSHPPPEVSEKFPIEKFAQNKAASQSLPHIKENILYDLQRLCPNPPFDPSVFNAPCRKPPQPDCPRPPKFYRSFSTLGPAQEKPLSLQLFKILRRSTCDDTSGKCKPRKLIPKAKECPKIPPKFPDCAELKLPCCPPAKIPPSCHIKDPKEECKKKKPPKPSFSECAKDLPLCPKMTECDCWDKKDVKPGKK